MSRRRPSRFNGLLPVYKEPGPTSHDVVDMARRALHERRIGHTGTLDPAAEGLLLLCVGQTTRVQRYLLEWDKTYRGLIRLGHATTTYDADGEAMEPSGPPPDLEREDLDALEKEFSGTIEQLPPPYSAKKVAGKKLYELARSGQQVTVDPKLVTIQDIRIEPEDEACLQVEVRASSGFYVRSLAHDIGVRLGCGAHLQHLLRVSIGPYEAARALPQADLENAPTPETIIEGDAWISVNEIALPFAHVSLNPAACDRFRHGQEVIVFRPNPEPLAVSDQVAVSASGGDFLGIGTIQNVLARGRTITVRPAMVLETAPPRRR